MACMVRLMRARRRIDLHAAHGVGDLACVTSLAIMAVMVMMGVRIVHRQFPDAGRVRGWTIEGQLALLRMTGKASASEAEALQ